jgi:MFS family permease
LSRSPLSARFAGLAGCLWAHQLQGLDPDPLAPFQNLLILTYVIIGGVTTPLGAIIGAAYWIGLGNLLPVRWQILASGLGVLIVLLVLPSGIGGLFYRLRDRWLARVARQHDIAAPGLSTTEPEAPLGTPESPCRARADPDRGGGLMKLKKPPTIRAWLLGITGGPRLPDPRALRSQRGRRARPHRLGVLVPNIRDAFGLNLTGLLALVGAVSVVALALQIPIASLSDRHNRVLITWVGALAWAFFSLLTGLAWSVIVLGIARAGSGIGKAVVDPTHNSLIADYYDIPSRPRVYSFHRAANAVGAIIGPLTAGIIATGGAGAGRSSSSRSRR